MAPQITLFVHYPTPNPVKVAILLEELNIEYEMVSKEFGDGPNGVKHPDFEKINPNGRVPAIIDHANNDKIVWESGAILLYLAERYDKSGKFAGKNLDERAQVWEWLFYQVSGIGPMQGQANWFRMMHPVKDLHPSVIERYQNECYRMYGVLEKRLEKEGDWVAIKRFTVADIAFYPWIAGYGFAGVDLTKYPRVLAYIQRMKDLPSVQKAEARSLATKH